MKLSLLAGGAVGYVLGARAGRERYDQLVRAGRRIAGSQSVQACAGVVQARLGRRSYGYRTNEHSRTHA